MLHHFKLKAMKKSAIIILLVIAILKTQAQDYLVSFAATGDTTEVGTVKVDNLTSGATVTLYGGDILHLIGAVGIGTTDIDNMNFQIYPNPMAEQSILTFVAPGNGNAVISIVDLSGRTVYQITKLLSSGANSFRVSGISRGMYFVKVNSNSYNYSTKLVSQNTLLREVKIELVSSVKHTSGNHLKSISATIDMLYTEGDLLLYTSISGHYSTLVSDAPTSSKTMTFNFVACTDADNNNYSVVQIGTQIWMAENLDYLPLVSPSSSNSLTTPVYYVNGYQGTSVDEAKAHPSYITYGVLYNWEAARTACPQGWHLPSDEEWTILTNYLGLSASGMMKESGTVHWNSPNTSATNESGFTALPAGARDDMSIFGSIGRYIFLWSSSARESSAAWYRYLYYSDDEVHRTYCYRNYGFSVRCVKD